MLLELEAMKKQEEIDEELAAKNEILAEELEIAKLEQEKERAKRISEKKMEIAEAGVAEQVQVCEASPQYSSTVIRLKRYLPG